MTLLTNPNTTKLSSGPGDEGNSASAVSVDVLPGDFLSVQFPGLSRIASLYVDNGRGTAPLFIKWNDTGRLLIVPPGAEGCYYSFSNDNSITVNQPSTEFPVRARLRAFSCHQPVFERFPGAGPLEAPWDVLNVPGSAVLGIQYTIPQPIGIGTGGWDANLLKPGIVITDSSKTAQKDLVSFSDIAIPARMRHQKLRYNGKWYFELSSTVAYPYGIIGVHNAMQFQGNSTAAVPANDLYFAYASGYYSLFSGSAVLYQNIVDNNPINSSGYGFALDLDNKLIYFRSSLGWAQNSDPELGRGGISISGMTFPIGPGVSSNGPTGQYAGSFGNERPFHFAVPRGFLAWNG